MQQDELITSIDNVSSARTNAFPLTDDDNDLMDQRCWTDKFGATGNMQSSSTSFNIPSPTTEETTCHAASPSVYVTKQFVMYYQNVRGLRTKTKDFKLSSTGCSFDIIALTETGLNSTIYDGELFNVKDFCV